MRRSTFPASAGIMAGLVLAGLGLAGHVRPLGGEPGTGRCETPLVVRAGDGVARHVCGIEALASLLRRCPPDGPVFAGDEVVVVERESGCAARRRPLPAAMRLRLGLRLDVNREPPDELQAVRGIGPATARRLVAGRPYRTLRGLERVRGIGPIRRRRLARWLRVRPPPPLWPPSPRRAGAAPRTPAGSRRGSAD